MGPKADLVGCGLSGTAGRLAAPLWGRHSRREDGRLDCLRCLAACRRGGDRRAARMVASGGCIRLYACSSLKQHAVLEQARFEGALPSKASCIVLVEASHVPGEGEEQGLLMKRGGGPDGGRGAQ